MLVSECLLSAKSDGRFIAIPAEPAARAGDLKLVEAAPKLSKPDAFLLQRLQAACFCMSVNHR
jgi:hypothetical protein